VIANRNDASVGSAQPSRATDPVVWWILAGALLLHVLLMPAPGWERDLYWFATWMRAAVDHGVARVADVVWCDYPPGYLYALKGVGWLWLLITGAPLPGDGTLAMRVLIKSIPTMADLGTAWVLYRLAAERRSRAYALLVLAAYAYNPAMLFNSAVWGQADALVSLLLLLSLWAIGSGRFAIGFAVVAAAVLVKLQAVVVVPIFVLVTWRIGGMKGFFDAWRGAAIAAAVVLAPFFVAHRMDALLATMFGASGRYPYISMNAHNLWWLVEGPDAPHVSDAMRVGNGLLTYHALGAAMLGAATMLILWRLWRALYRSDREPLLSACEACLLEIMAFYLFPTEMHERYILSALMFLAAVCIYRPHVWWLYGVGSLATLLSLASTLNAIFPQGLWSLEGLLPADRVETVGISVLFFALFLGLLLWTPDRRFRLLAPAAVGVVASVIAGAAVVPLRHAQRLGDWEPIEASQEWGTMRHNRSVDDHRLAVFGFIFRHGIGTHAHSTLTYHLNGVFRTLDTAFAIDDEANRGQKIRFRILTDGAVRYDSGDISGVGFPRHVQVPVDGAQRLTLEVLDGGDGIDSDHADWLEPVLLR
jgi:dolichyl-phosphate-mannose-protein mannosyltransferase